MLSAASSLVQSQPAHVNGKITLTITGREAIPEILKLLVQENIRVYHMAAHEPTLEDVYFALHDEKETNQ